MLSLVALTFLNSCKKERTTPLSFNHILVFGNSITIHPPLPAIGWYGNWGMAASKKENDYCHILASKLDAQVKPVNISDWENTHVLYDFKKFDSYFIDRPDLIIIRLGENVKDITDFKESLQKLVSYINNKGLRNKMVITGCFWKNEKLDQILNAVANENNLPFIKLSQLEVLENVSAIGTIVYDEDGKSYTISDQGVANHPGDLGMRRIAETIYQDLNLAYF